MTGRKQSADAKAISIRDAIYIGGLLLSMGTMYGIIGNRISTLEANFQQAATRYEREVVPRAEHVQMNAVLEQRLSAIIESQKQSDKQIESIQMKLDQLMERRK